MNKEKDVKETTNETTNEPIKETTKEATKATTNEPNKELDELKAKLINLEQAQQEKDNKIKELTEMVQTFTPSENKKEKSIYAYEQDTPKFVKQIMENAKQQMLDPNNTKGRNN